MMRLGASLYESTLHGDETLVLPAVDRWKRQTGFYPSIVPLWSPFEHDVPAPRGGQFPSDWLLRGMRKRGVEPAVFAHSATAATWATHGYEAILRGERDEALEAWGHAAAQYGHRLILRWDHEMNGFFPWSWLPQQLYIDVFRHVSDRIRKVAGAHNVKMHFCPILAIAGPDLDVVESYYPGDDWVQRVGFDGFSWYQKWEPLAQRWGPLIDRLERITDAPIIVGEFGRRIDYRERPEWLDSLRAVRGVASVIYFDMNLTHHPYPMHHWRMDAAMRKVFKRLPKRKVRLERSSKPDDVADTELIDGSNADEPVASAAAEEELLEP